MDWWREIEHGSVCSSSANPLSSTTFDEREQLLSAIFTLDTAAEIKELFQAFHAVGVDFFQKLKTEPWGRKRSRQPSSAVRACAASSAGKTLRIAARDAAFGRHAVDPDMAPSGGGASGVAGHVVAVNDAEIELGSGRSFSPASGAK